MGKVFLFAFATIQCGCVSAQVYVCVSGCVFCCARIYTCAANICIQFFYSFSLFFFQTADEIANTMTRMSVAAAATAISAVAVAATHVNAKQIQPCRYMPIGGCKL